VYDGSSCILDDCMAKLFTDGSILNKSIEWMDDDNKDLSLKTTAALIIANMARTGLFLNLNILVLILMVLWTIIKAIIPSM